MPGRGLALGPIVDLHLDGRNILSDGTLETMRVDDLSSQTLKLFVYDVSETWPVEHQPSVPGQQSLLAAQSFVIGQTHPT